ncbi:G patch domain-containing protein 1 [Stigmatopora nigra]
MAAFDEDVKCPTDFVVYGTALEPLEEDEAPRKPLPLHEQTVRDEKGRYQRFHGAFTGGFSAGYFNTVGSKEGWTPSTFVSSRQQKAEKQEATPRDFMDDEDLGEHGIAPSRITTTQPFASRAPRDVAEAPGALAAALPGSELLDELIAPAAAGVGAELLTRMGWKAGQGVGPRVKRKPRRQRVFGCAPPPTGSEESQEDDDDEEFAPENATFAPKDVVAVDFGARAGVQGLGYRGLDPALALRGNSDAHLDFFSPHSDATSRLFGEKRRVSRRLGGVAGQAFGVGALEDDDDEDVYHRDAMSKYDTVLADEPGDGLYGWTAPRGASVTAVTAGGGHRREASYLGKILEGFALARGSRENQTAAFPPPKLPDDYRPLRRFRRRVEVSHLSGVSAAPGAAGAPTRAALPEDAGRHRVVAAQRGALLGEPVLPGPSSVMELLKPEDRQRLLRLRGAPEPTTTTTSALRREEEAAAAAWRGLHGQGRAFKPFQKNDAKQARYEAYLERLRGGHKDAAEASLDPSMTEWERGREKEEFVRASVLYRPTSSALASRFTRAKDDDAGDDLVEVPRDQEGSTEKDKEAAVRMKMFGQLTRESLEWHPDKILCKRFNVPHPYPGSAVVGLPKVKRDKFSIFNFLTVAPGDPPPPLASKKSRWDQEAVTEKEDPAQAGALKEESRAVKTEPPDPARDGKREAVAVAAAAPAEADEEETEGEADDDDDEEEVEEETRPPMDVFKAIFASSSDEASSSSSDGEDGDAGEDGEGAPSAALFAVSSRQTATADGVSPADGVSLAPPPRQDAEFGPALPPPWFVPVASASPARELGRKKRDKSKKDKKKKKSKKKRDKAKRQEDKKKKKTKAQGPRPHADGRTEDLIGRLKRVSSGILR